MSWQPIESAPKDGTEVLIFVPTKIVRKSRFATNVYDAFVTIGRFHVPGNPESQPFWVGQTGIYNRTPTHWMPLPEPPHD